MFIDVCCFCWLVLVCVDVYWCLLICCWYIIWYVLHYYICLFIIGLGPNLPVVNRFLTDWAGSFAMGFPTGKIEPQLCDLQPGQQISVVMDVLVYNPGSHVCKTFLHHQTFVTDACIQKGVAQYTILQGTVHFVDGKRWILVNETTKVFPRPQLDTEGLFRIVEACAGVSAVSQGYAACTATTVCTVFMNGAKPSPRSLVSWATLPMQPR